MKEYQQYCDPGVTSREFSIQTDQHVRLNVIHFKPPAKSEFPPVVMVVGLGTFIQSFQGILAGMTRHFEVYYVETREKTSSEITGTVPFDVNTISKDIVSVIHHLFSEPDEYILFGYSYGATVIAVSYQYFNRKPDALLLLSPTPHFYYPSWSLPLIKNAPAYFSLVRFVAKWYLRNFVINYKEDRDMYRYTSFALDNCDPQKLSKAILGVAGYSIWHNLPHIDCSTLVVDTSKDGIHRHEDILRLASSINRCTYVDMEINKRTHGEELAEVIRSYLLDLTRKE